MARISDKEIAAHVKAAGFPRKAQATAVAVALAESGGDPLAKNTANSNGSTDYGLFQINSVHAQLLRSGSWSNPADNARMARAVYRDAGNSFRPWVAYTSGSYLVFVGRARNAVDGTAPPGREWDIHKWGGPTSPLETAGVFVSMFTDRDLWIRAVMFAAGALLIIWGLLAMTSLDDSLRKSAVKVAAFAATKGKVKA